MAAVGRAPTPHQATSLAAGMQGGTLDVRIKWPNDLYAGGLKLGGVLCHSVFRARRFATVTGVGLNLDNAEPTTCVNALLAARHAELGVPGAPAPVAREVPPGAAALLSNLTLVCRYRAKIRLG